MRRPHRDLALGLTFLLSIAVLARADDTTESREVVSKWAYYNNVAWGAFRKGDLELADYRFRKAIEVLRPHEKEHVRLMARSCHDLSRVLCAQGRYSEAEPFARWVVAARDADAEVRQDSLFDAVYLLAIVERELGRHDEVVPLLSRAVAIEEKNVPLSDPQLALTIKELADAEARVGSLEEADAHYRRAIRIHEYADKPTPDLAEAVEGRVAVLDRLGRAVEARKLEARARDIRDRLTGEATVRRGSP